MQIDAGKPHGPGMPHDVSERDDAGPALRRVHPVAGPGILADIRFAAPPDVKAVEGMERDRNPYAEQLKSGYKREAAQETHLARIRSRAAGCHGVRNEDVFEQECADRNNAG